MGELPSRCPRDLRESILATSVPLQAILCSGSSEGGAGERLPLQTALGGDAAQGDHAARVHPIMHPSASKVRSSPSGVWRVVRIRSLMSSSNVYLKLVAKLFDEDGNNISESEGIEKIWYVWTLDNLWNLHAGVG